MAEAVMLGIIQGLTEYLPISSTAHLILFAWLTGADGIVSTMSFDVALHLGTLLAVVCYFYRDWIEMVRTRRKLFALVCLATVPAGLAGYFLNDFVEQSLRSPIVIAFALIIVGMVMWIAEAFPKTKDIHGMSLVDALFVGVAQVLALIPGVSRSGITISAGLFRNVDRESAARFSFLLSTPIIAGATFLHLGALLTSAPGAQINILAAGIFSSAVSGFLAIRFLMRFFRRYTLRPFVYYRVVLGLGIMVITWMKG